MLAMDDIEVYLPAVNFELLGNELSSVGSDLVLGMSYRKDTGLLRVHVSSGASREDIDAVLDKIETHDETLKTPDQVTREIRDKSELFTLSPDGAVSWVCAQSDAEFKRRMTRAFVELRMMVRGE